MELYPPDDPFLINTTLFGLPIQVRWYGVIIMVGALLAAMLAARRARARGYDSEDVWNTLMLGLVLSIICARAYYVFFEWERFAGRSILEIINPATGGIAIHGAIIGAVLAAFIYARWKRLPVLEWWDICVPGLLLGQAIGRWGNFFNQEAYGRPTSLPIGVRIDPDHRLPPYNNMQTYPPDMLFHATFLYESLWNLLGVGLLLLIDRRFGFGAPAGRRWLRNGDLLAIYGIYYSIGRFFVEGLRTDSLCTAGLGGECEGTLRTAQVVSLLLIALCSLAIFLNHRRRLPPAATAAPSTAAAADEPPAADDLPAAADTEQAGRASPEGANG
jgi:phosphatidylglycerol:prolipoprotein diacylglycerol transferase